MKRIIAAALLCVMLCGLTGCALFERSYSSITPHQEQSASERDASILRAETYADLVSCVQHFVSMGQTAGTIHVYKYSGDIESDLDRAANEVLTEDPLGSYALRSIDFSYSRIVSYYECQFTFAYRRSLEDMASITVAYGDAAIRDLMQQTLSSFSSTVTLRTSSFYSDRSRLHALARQAYYASPSTALGYPDVSITIYPETGTTRIVEVNFVYPHWSQATMTEWAQAVDASAVAMVGQDRAANETVAWLLYSRLEDHTAYDAEGSESVYAALCGKRANSVGLALGYQVLCQQAGIDCMLVQGTLNGVPHCWNLITLGENSRLVDLTRADPENAFLHGDDEFLTGGYNWSREDYPACGELTGEE